MQHHFKELRRELARLFDFVFEDEVSSHVLASVTFYPVFIYCLLSMKPNLLTPFYGLLSRTQTM